MVDYTISTSQQTPFKKNTQTICVKRLFIVSGNEVKLEKYNRCFSNDIQGNKTTPLYTVNTTYSFLSIHDSYKTV